MKFIKKVLSYFLPIHLHKFESKHSGELIVALENGKKVLNTRTVNYSYHSLHQVFQVAFQKSGLLTTSIQHTLLLGLGGGSIVSILRNDYQIKTPIKAIEIDPQVIELALQEFNITQYAPLEIVESDALEYAQHDSNRYDLICVDLFINDQVPPQFLQTSFIEILLQLTLANGSIYFNLMLSSTAVERQFNQIYTYLKSTINTSITDVYYIDVHESNRILVIKK